MIDRPVSQKDPDAYRTIGEVAEELKLPQHVLRFWETRFPQIKPLKRSGSRRFYKPEDVALLRAIQSLLYGEGYTIKGVQRVLTEFGARHVAEALARSAAGAPDDGGPERPDRGRETEAAMAKDATPGRGDPLHAASRRAPPPREPAGARPFPDRLTSDLAARLESVLAELVECARLLASTRSTAD